MKLRMLRLLFDFGLVVLIWLVQLVIYPSFRYYAPNDLLEWHALYTQRVSYVVLPLMLGQLILSLVGAFQNPGFPSWSILLLVLGTWLTTFVWFVPMHQQIASGDFGPDVLQRLVSFNWIRTALWTIIFVLGVWQWSLERL